MKRACAFFGLLFLADAATAQLPPPAAKIPPVHPPTLVVLEKVNVEKQIVEHTITITVVIPVLEAMKVVKDGKEVIVETVRHVPELRVETRTIALKDVRIFLANGRNITAADAIARMKPGLAVALASDEPTVRDGRYATVLKQETVILVTAAPPAAPMDVPVPPAPKKAP